MGPTYLRLGYTCLTIYSKQVNVKLSGLNLRVDTEYLTVTKAKTLKLVDKNHKIWYMSPFTAAQPGEQKKMLEAAGYGVGVEGSLGPISHDTWCSRPGLTSATVVGLDLEWGGPRYPTNRTKASIYDASLLVLSCASGTVLVHLYMYQDLHSKCMHWPGPYLTKIKENGKWVKAKKVIHGEKWVLPSALYDFFKAASDITFTGRKVNSDFTRLRNVFGDLDCFKKGKVMDVNTLRSTKQYRSASSKDGLGDWLHRVTGMKLADKGNKSVRTKGVCVRWCGLGG